MTQKEILLEQMSSTHDQKGWFVPMKYALAGVTAELAIWHNESDEHSIWQIVNHLIFWNERWQRRFLGTEPPKMEGDNKSTFKVSPGLTQKEWELAVNKFDSVMKKWAKAIKDKHEEEFSNAVFNNAPDSWYSYLHTIAMHNAYHIGQIVTLRKMHGSWDSGLGVAS